MISNLEFQTWIASLNSTLNEQAVIARLSGKVVYQDCLSKFNSKLEQQAGLAIFNSILNRNLEYQNRIFLKFTFFTASDFLKYIFEMVI